MPLQGEFTLALVCEGAEESFMILDAEQEAERAF
jgi:hypothetical protein